MASYKFEVSKRLGKYQAKFYPVGVQKPEQEFSDIEDVVGFAGDAVSKLDLDEDSVIFRDVAYSSATDLKRAIKNAPV